MTGAILAVHAVTVRSAEPWPWLFLPFGLAPATVVGYLTIAVIDEVSRAGVPLGSVSLLVAAVFVPPSLMFVWAPMVDLVGRRPHWLLAGILFLCVSAAGLALTHRTPSGFPWLLSFAALAGFGYSLVSASQKGLAVELFAASRRVAAAGWVGAGAGIGLAVGGGMRAVDAHLSPLAVACVLIVLAGLPAIAALAALERFRAPAPPAAPTLREVAQDTGRLLRSRQGRLALAICVLPIGSSAAGLMVGALGEDFGAAAGFVGAWAGTGKSLAFAAGALAGARLWQRTGSRAGCLLSVIGFASFSLLLLAVPRSPAAYALTVGGFGFLQGAALPAVVGLILETVEQRAAATQAAVLVAAGNLANVYLPPLGGWAHDAGGLSMLFMADVAIGAGALVAYLLCARALHQHPWRTDPPGP